MRVLARNTVSRHDLGHIFYGQVRSGVLKVRIEVKTAEKRKHEREGEKERNSAITEAAEVMEMVSGWLEMNVNEVKATVDIVSNSIASSSSSSSSSSRLQKPIRIVKLLPQTDVLTAKFVGLNVSELAWRSKKVLLSFPNDPDKNKCVGCNQHGHKVKDCPSAPRLLRVVFNALLKRSLPTRVASAEMNRRSLEKSWFTSSSTVRHR